MSCRADGGSAAMRAGRISHAFLSPLKDAAGKHGVQGLTLIELMVIIAIKAILTAISFPIFVRTRDEARRLSHRNPAPPNLRSARVCIAPPTK